MFDVLNRSLFSVKPSFLMVWRLLLQRTVDVLGCSLHQRSADGWTRDRRSLGDGGQRRRKLFCSSSGERTQLPAQRHHGVHDHLTNQSINQPLRPQSHLAIEHLSVHPFIRHPFIQHIHPNQYQSIHLFIHSGIQMTNSSIYTPKQSSIYPSIHLPILQTIHPFIEHRYLH